MSDAIGEIINEGEDNLTGIVIDGVPYVYWLQVYRVLELTRTHSYNLIKRLEEGKHFIRFSKKEFNEKCPTVHVTATVNSRVSALFFITEEGYHRAIMEISTGHMINQEIAADINAKKDHMANIYIRYRRGEVLSIRDE